MYKDKFIFAQLVEFMDRNRFNYLVKKYGGDKYVKSYTYWNQLLTMIFGQLSNRESLRDLIVAMEAHAGKLYHLGIGKSVTRSNLSKANEQREYRIFEEFAFSMISEARRRRIQKIFELEVMSMPSAPPTELPIEETPTGDVLNVVLGYEAKELKHLNTTTYYAYLVNDSNYFLYFTYFTRNEDTGEWTTRYHGVVEPNIQIMMEEFDFASIRDVNRVAVQYIAFKVDKPFAPKNPALVEHRLDTSKFHRLHCFHDNEYFDNPVIAIDIVRGDVPSKQMVIDSGDLERALRMKRAADKPERKPVEKKKKDEIPVIDLHIHELVDTTAGMGPADILAYQMQKFREAMDEHKKHLGAKLIFIHGKGEGVLRKALLDELKRRYPRCTAQDASFMEYGFGATQITIH